MKNFKAPLIFLWIIMAFVGYDICLTIFYFQQFLTPDAILLPIYFLCNLMILTAFVIIGINLFRLIKTYDKNRYFDEKSLRLVQIIAVALILLAPLQSFNQTLSDYVLHPRYTPKEILIQFTSYFLFKSPSFLFSGVLIFLFADFMKRAISLKHDNESII